MCMAFLIERAQFMQSICRWLRMYRPPGCQQSSWILLPNSADGAGVRLHSLIPSELLTQEDLQEYRRGRVPLYFLRYS